MQQRLLGETGLSVSILSYGASPLGSVFRDVDENEGIACVHRALELGVNLIDCSPYYGLTRAETVLGRALQGVPRDSYVLATKVGRYGADFADFDFSAARVTRSIDESLARLGAGHIDIIQCHDVEFGDLRQIVNETIPALRRAVEAGKARFIGVTGLPLRVFTEIAAQVKIDTILSYCRYSLNDQSLTTIAPFLEAKGIGIINASPLGMGLLTARGAPDWHPAPPEVKEACARAVEFCEAKGASIEKLAVQFALADPQFASTLVGTANPRNIERNIEWAQTPLDEELLREVQAILAPIANQTWQSGRPENNDS